MDNYTLCESICTKHYRLPLSEHDVYMWVGPSVETFHHFADKTADGETLGMDAVPVETNMATLNQAEAIYHMQGPFKFSNL